MKFESNESPGDSDLASGKATGIMHQGVIEAYHNGVATVRVTHDSEGGCAACGARDGCGLAAAGGGKPASTVEIPFSQPLEKGQRVTVMLGRNSDWKATLIAFVLPVALMVGGLGLGSALKISQLATAFLALGCLVGYGLILLLFRSRLKKTFSMSIISVE